MFFEDAEVASRILEITLTSRNKKDNSPIPMCGVPCKAAQGYIARLIEYGCKVAICEQLEAPGLGKGPVKRDVVRVITPGMILEDELLDKKSNNYILSINIINNTAGISYLDISTGTFRVSESEDLRFILDEVLRVSPSEVLFPKSFSHAAFFPTFIEALSEKSVTYLDDTIFQYRKGRQRLIEQFKTVSLEGFGCEDLKAGVSAAGALIYYVCETQKQQIEHFFKIETYSLGNYLLVDNISCNNLELLKNIRTGSNKGALIGILDKTVTSMGGRLLKKWLRYPLLDVQEIRSRQNAVEEAKNNIQIRKSLRDSLKFVYDLERLGSKISMGHSNAGDLIALKHSIDRFPCILSDLIRFKSSLYKWNISIENLYDIAKLIEKAIRDDAPSTISDGGIIKTGYNSELDELIMISRDGKGKLAKMETEQKSLTGINSLKVRYNKVFGYYIEIPKTHINSIPPHYVRKQTLVNAERYITEELKTYEAKVLGAQEKRITLEYKLFNEIRGVIVNNNKTIYEIAQFLARLDCLLCLAEVADQNNYKKPEINDKGHILIEDGRHPVVEKMIEGERFVPNSISMDNCKNQVLIITGPNMAGKSTVLRQVALLVILAQIGSFVPAAKASISITDRIFTRVGALDNLSSGQSTFMVEMEETANILNNATSKSLVIMDEIGRGTSTFDGLSIAWAVVEFMHDLNEKGVKTLFATHYHELTRIEQTKSRVKNYNIAVKEWNDEIIFLRKLVEGGTNRSYGIQVARLAGIPDKVIRRAKKILFDIENNEHSPDAPRIMSKIKVSSGKKYEQLNLFYRPERVVTKKLQDLDISTLTPLDALNYLDEMQKEIKFCGTSVHSEMIKNSE